MTAVEWLYEQLNGLNKPILDEYFQTVFSEAKEVEKQQIIDAISESNKSNNRNISLNPEQYYNKTFKK